MSPDPFKSTSILGEKISLGGSKLQIGSLNDMKKTSKRFINKRAAQPMATQTEVYVMEHETPKENISEIRLSNEAPYLVQAF